jgi:putative protein-disulfide isomerase
MAEQRNLWYFADPMCSWCWGFAPVISAIRENYADRLQLTLVMGGLRPGTTQSTTPAFRAEILHHWQEVQRRSGQPFKFEGALPDGFVYDTEPACRAVVTMLDLNGAAAFPYFKSIQAAFYAEGQDVTQSQTLGLLAEREGVAADRFLERFESAEIRQMTQAHFRQTAEIGVRGFPTVILQNGERFELLTHGYQPLEDVTPILDQWLSKNAVSG